MDDSELTQEELEKLIQYQEVTGIEDITLARLYLSQNNWNVEVAVQNHLSMQDSPQRSPNNIRPRSQSFSAASSDANGIVLPERHFYQGIWDFLWSLPSKLFVGVFQWCYYILSFPIRLIIPYPRRLIDPLGDIVNFVNEFELEYGVQHPAFFHGSYSQVLNHAKTELKFLLLYLHCKDNQDTPQFCRSTLSDPTVIEFINTSVIFWGCSVTSGEGYRVSQALRENAYPFLALIVLKDNKMTVVGRLEGPQDSSQLILQLQDIIRDSEAYLVVARADRQERELTAALRQEQDVAYLESLRADQEKARKKRCEQEAQTRQEEEEREQEQSLLQEKEKRLRLKFEWADRIPDEPEEGDDVIHIVVKLPQGTRLNRRFHYTESLAGLYYYIFCYPDSPDRFQVTTNYPRKTLPCEPTDEVPIPPSFRDLGLPPRSMLFVIDLDA